MGARAFILQSMIGNESLGVAGASANGTLLERRSRLASKGRMKS